MAEFLNNLSENNQFIKMTRKKYFVDKSELIRNFNELVNSDLSTKYFFLVIFIN